MEKLPRYSTELIEWLDANVGRPKFPETAGQVANLDEKTVRIGCFWSGRRALVDELVAFMKESNDADTSEKATGDASDLGLGQVLDTDGSGREDVASTHVAARFVDAMPDDSSDDA